MRAWKGKSRMKLNQQLFAKLRETTQKLLATRPVANDFVSELLGRLGIQPGLEGGQHEVEIDASSAGRFISGSYSNQSGSRTYKLYIPSSYCGQSLPLMVFLHG